jgi:hypothetical protein
MCEGISEKEVLPNKRPEKEKEFKEENPISAPT